MACALSACFCSYLVNGLPRNSVMGLLPLIFSIFFHHFHSDVFELELLVLFLEVLLALALQAPQHHPLFPSLMCLVLFVASFHFFLFQLLSVFDIL